MQCIDLSNHCSGPTYTFCDSRGNKSYIDHCAIQSVLKDYITDICVWPKVTGNRSDHLPICVKVDVDVPRISTVTRRPEQIAWGKLDDHEIKKRYTDPLEESIVNIAMK